MPRVPGGRLPSREVVRWSSGASLEERQELPEDGGRMASDTFIAMEQRDGQGEADIDHKGDGQTGCYGEYPRDTRAGVLDQ